MIFINTVNGVQRETLFSSAEVIALTAVLYAFFFLESLFLAKVFRLKGNTALVYRAISMFGNIGFMGIPIISSIYPQSGMLYISLVTIVDQSVLWTLGVKLTTPEGAEGGFKLKKMINPATTAIALALVFIIARIPVPGVINTGLQKIGGTATPLAMIYLGGVFACMDIRRYAFRPELYGIVLVKMLVAPILVYLVLGFVPIFADLRMTIALLTALPAMASAVMMAKASGSEGDYAMGGIFVTNNRLDRDTSDCVLASSAFLYSIKSTDSSAWKHFCVKLILVEPLGERLTVFFLCAGLNRVSGTDASYSAKN